MATHEKHIKSGSVVNHWFYAAGNNYIELIQTDKNKAVFEDYIQYDTSDDAWQVFKNL